MCFFVLLEKKRFIEQIHGSIELNYDDTFVDFVRIPLRYSPYLDKARVFIVDTRTISGIIVVISDRPSGRSEDSTGLFGELLEHFIHYTV